MSRAFWRGDGPVPGELVWLADEISERSVKVLTGEPQKFDFGKWKAAVSLRQRLQWMENLYESKDVLFASEEAAQAPVKVVSWPGDSDIAFENGIRAFSKTTWEGKTAEEMIDQVLAYKRMMQG